MSEGHYDMLVDAIDRFFGGLPARTTADPGPAYNARRYVRAETYEAEIIRLRTDLVEVAGGLEAAIAGWEDCAQYKDAYIREKHGDEDRIAVARAILAKHAEPKP